MTYLFYLIDYFLYYFMLIKETFSGSGEPTLNSDIGWMIEKIKKHRYNLYIN
jgi:hypothetical protein